MRRFLSLLFSVAVFGFIAYVGYSMFIAWLNPTPIEVPVENGRPVVAVTQPTIKPWTTPIDNSGYDISSPQCKTTYPSASVGFAIVGLNFGKPFTKNPCVASELSWAKQHVGYAVYINMADPGSGSATRYGQRIAADTIARLHKLGVATNVPIWLDIETNNTWTESSRSVQVITETMAVLAAAGHPVGIYSVPVHWFEITMNATIKTPTWLALGPYTKIDRAVSDAKAACLEMSFGNQTPSIVQFVTTKNGRALDHNYMCARPDGLVAPSR